MTKSTGGSFFGRRGGVKRFPDGRGKLLAYAVAGHHAGLLMGKVMTRVWINV